MGLCPNQWALLAVIDLGCEYWEVSIAAYFLTLTLVYHDILQSVTLENLKELKGENSLFIFIPVALL